MSVLGSIRRVAGALWRVLDNVRKALHLILLLVLVIVVLGGLAPQLPQVPGPAALVIAPQGELVDQLSGDPVERALARARGLPLQETLLRDLIDAIREARDDERIEAIVLQLDSMTESGLSKLQELGDALLSFRESGKPVVAVGDGFSRSQYHVAAQADTIYMHPMGFVLVDGYSRFLPYFRSALDNLYVDYHVWTVGEYKSFVEPITRDDMSPEDREASEAFIGGLWQSYQNDVTAARELPVDALQRYADDAVMLLRDAGGDAAQLAMNYGLVDELLPRDQIRERLRALVGADGNGDGYARIGHEQYLGAVRGAVPNALPDNKVAVIVASGTILDGEQPPGTIGGDSTAQLIRRAADDEQVRAMVLRIDSPGGSAFASDVILRELEVFQQSGRPLVVSMSSVAASGGYWIAMGADEIWAHSTTLTGSIGVGATFPTFPRALEQLGINIDGVGTTELSGQFDPTRELGPDAALLLTEMIRNMYQRFVDKVAEHRGRSVDEIDRVARGRVWTGADALSRGLVDELGGLEDAVHSAAELAGLEEGDYRLQYFDRRLSFAQRLALQYAGVLAPVLAAVGDGFEVPPALGRLLDLAAEPFTLFERMNDPRGIYAYCFCQVR